MVEQMKKGWPVSSVVSYMTDEIYRRVLDMSPRLYTDYGTSVQLRLGDHVRMLDGQVVVLDRETVAQGWDVELCAQQVIEPMRPYLGFMSNTSHFVAVVLSADRDLATGDREAHVIWGVA